MVNSKSALNYLITFETFLLQPVIEGNKKSTLVIERNQDFILPVMPSYIVKKSCKYHGRSLENAILASKQIFGNRHKLPIIIVHHSGMPLIFLPTMASTSIHTIWIALHAISNIIPHKTGCIICLENDLEIKTNVSATTMERQISLGNLLQKDFLKKQRSLNRNSFYGPYDTI